MMTLLNKSKIFLSYTNIPYLNDYGKEQIIIHMLLFIDSIVNYNPYPAEKFKGNLRIV